MYAGTLLVLCSKASTNLVPCHGQFYNSFFDLLYQLAQVHPHNVLHFPNKLLVLGQFALNTLERLICNVSTNQPALNS